MPTSLPTCVGPAGEAASVAGVAPNWANRTSGSAPPSEDASYSVAFDAQENCTVLFETRWSVGQASTWLYCNQAWRNLPTNATSSPPPDDELGMAYDAHDGYVILFGGGPYGIHNFTWKFENDTWTNITATAGAPPGRASPSFAYDTADGCIIMFGGWSGSAVLGDTWKFQGGTWTRLYAGGSGSPSARESAGFAFDRQDNGTILYGGDDGKGHPFNDTWAFSNGSWIRLSTGGLPDFAGVPVTSPDGTLWTYGYLGQTAEYVAGTWLQLPSGTGGTVPPDYSFGVAYDVAAEDEILIGASILEWTWGSGTETWTLGGTPSVTATVTPATVEIGTSTNISASTAGGRGNLSLAYAGLPTGVGCASRNAGHLTCAPAQAGQFTIVVTVTDGTGNRSSTSVSLEVLPGPSVQGALSQNVVDAHLHAVTFSVEVMNGTAPFSYNWTGLPTGCVAGPPPLTCWPASPGTFSVGITVRDAVGEVGGYTFALLTVVPPVVASVHTSGLTGLGPLAIGLWVTAYFGVSPYFYDWRLGDGTSSSAVNFTHQYPTPGVYQIQLVVNDSGGASYYWNGTVLVYPAPQLTASASPSEPEVGWPLLLESGSSGGPPNPTYSWSGLPSPCVGANVTNLSCVPESAGTYEVIVSASLGGTALAMSTVTFTVHPRLAGGLTLGGSAVGCGAYNASFTAYPSGGIQPYTYAWMFGDGTNSTGGPSTSHVYHGLTSTGAYTVELLITDLLGATSVLWGSVVVGSTCNSASGAGGPLTGAIANVALGALAGALVASLVVWTMLRRGRSGRRPAP